MKEKKHILMSLTILKNNIFSAKNIFIINLKFSKIKSLEKVLKINYKIFVYPIVQKLYLDMNKFSVLIIFLIDQFLIYLFIF